MPDAATAAAAAVVVVPAARAPLERDGDGLVGGFVCVLLAVLAASRGDSGLGEAVDFGLGHAKRTMTPNSATAATPANTFHDERKSADVP